MEIEYICKNCKSFTEREYCGQGKRKYYCMNRQKKVNRKDKACDKFIYKYIVCGA